MNNFDYKQIFYYTPPVLILLLVFGYYWAIKDIPRANVLPGNNTITKTETQAVQDALDKNDFAGANTVIEEMLSRNSNDVQALLLKAQNLAQEASLTFKEKELGDQARKIAESVLAIEPNNLDAIVLVGYTYEIQENYTKAHSYYDLGLKINPTNTNALSQKAHAYFLEGKEVEAKQYYEMALTSDPESTKASFGLAKLLAMSGEYQEAKNIFASLAAKTNAAREKAEYYYSASVISENITPFNLSEIERLNNLALQADIKYALAHVQKSRIALAQVFNNPEAPTAKATIESAIDSLNTAIEINPKQAFAHLELAKIMSITGQTQNLNLIIKNLPSIINNDITLSKTEKEILLEETKAFQEINK